MKRKDKNGRILRTGEYYDPAHDRYSYKKMHEGRRYTLSSSSLIELRKQEAELNAAIEKEMVYRYDLNKLSLDEYFEVWYNNAGRSGRKATTLTMYKSYYETHVKGTKLGMMQISKIRKTHCQELFTNMITSGAHDNTLSNMKGCLNAIFSDAEDNDAISKNPCKNIRLKGTAGSKRNPIPEEQVSIFMSYVHDSDRFNKYYPYFVVLFNLGCRVGEIGALTWDSINFEENSLTIDKSLNRYRKKDYGFTVAIGTAKTGASNRTIVFNDTVREALKTQRKYDMESSRPSVTLPLVDDYGRVTGEVSNLVFTNSAGGPWIEPTVIDLIHRIVDAQNDEVEGSDTPKLLYFTPHQVRHTYTTLAYEAGVDEVEVADRLGHVSVKTTEDIYTHLRGKKKEEQDNIANRVSIQ